MSLNNSNTDDFAGGNNPNDKLGKLPFKTLTIKPSNELRMRILALKQQLGISAAEVAERLIATAAEVKIPWLIVKPQNGSEAGIAYEQVEKVMVKTFNLINQGVGVFYRLNANEKAKQLEVVRDGSLELWRVVQKLAKETFFDPQEFKTMCECHDALTPNIQQLSKEVQDEAAKEKPDQVKIEKLKKRIAGYETTKRVLKRLGCGEPHDAL
ncbi:MAG: hypothetical protein QM691_09155 [Opitutaceae bacterium]